MLLTMLCAVALLAVAALGFLTVQAMFSAHLAARNQAEYLALTGAKLLNGDDYTGQMNNLIARSRLLVFRSRNTYKRSVDDYPLLQSLARQLSQEAREGAQVVERERQKLIALRASQLKELSRQLQDNDEPVSTFPWISIYRPGSMAVTLGYVQGEQSNVTAPTADVSLAEFDKRKNYVDTDTNLYKGSINAKLPGPDDDLNFKLSSLPAPEKNQAPFPRLVPGKDFKKLSEHFTKERQSFGAVDQLPSTCHIELSARVLTTVGGEQEHAIVTYSTGLAPGAHPPP